MHWADKVHKPATGTKVTKLGRGHKDRLGKGKSPPYFICYTSNNEVFKKERASGDCAAGVLAHQRRLSFSCIPRPQENKQEQIAALTKIKAKDNQSRGSQSNHSQRSWFLLHPSLPKAQMKKGTPQDQVSSVTPRAQNPTAAAELACLSLTV